MELPTGKIPIDILKEVIFQNLGAKREEVVLGPSAGIDGAVINVGTKSLIVSMDPITGALERIGWLAVNVNANDVATFGVEPSFLLSCIMLPEKANRKTAEVISSQMDRAAKALRIAIVGGHCETTPGLVNPIVVGCMMGITTKGKYVTAGGAKCGDKLILTKSAGIEGTAILASDREKQLERTLGIKRVQKAIRLYDQISVVKDAITAFETGKVNAMHDPTEGGIIGGIYEIAVASYLGVEVFEERIPIQTETSKICDYFRIDPLLLVSSGALLISARPEAADKIVGNLRRKKIPAKVIGHFLKNPNRRTLIRRDGSVQALQTPPSDHLWVALAQK
jgi:hydrogenase expression/formation protein HypE